MNLPLQIVFRNMGPSDAVETRVRERVEKLEKHYEYITSCRVVVELEHRRHHHGNLYHVRVDLRVPDAELVVSREPGEHHAHEDVYVAIRDAFDAIGRQLEDYIRRRRGQVKQHASTPAGQVVEIYPDYGKIATPDGRRVYFHKNSVVDADFSRIDIGTEVRFTEEMGELGPQASTVHVLAQQRAAG